MNDALPLHLSFYIQDFILFRMIFYPLNKAPLSGTEIFHLESHSKQVSYHYCLNSLLVESREFPKSMDNVLTC